MGEVASFKSGSAFSNRDQQQQQQQPFPLPATAMRFGGTSAAAPAAATPTSMAWDDNDEPLPDMAPILRSVSSLVMSMDPEDGMSATSPCATTTAGRNRGTNNMVATCNSGSSSSVTERAKTQSGAALGSNALDMLMAPLPPTLMDSNTCLTREQSFPPPFGRPRFGRDPSFPPPVQVGGGSGGLTAVDMLPSAPSLRNTWSQVGRSIAASTETPCSSGGGTTTMAGGGVYAAGGGGGGGGPSLSRGEFQGLGFPGTGGGGGGGGGRLGVKQERQWENDHAGGRDHGGGGTGGRSLSDEDHQADYHPDDIIGGILPSSRPRRPSFDKLAAMIPGIPHWPVPPSPSSSPPAPTSSPSAGESSGELHAPAASGGGSAKAKQQAQFPLRTKTPRLSPSAPAAPAAPSSRGRQPKMTRADKKPKKHHNPTADSPTTAPWTAPTPPSPAANIPPKKTPSSGNGKRALETPLSCGPVRAGGGPVDLAKQERRRVKIQRYLYKRSRRKFAKSTRDASPSRSRPKAALLRPRVKGKFVKTTPDFVSVNAGGPPQREDGGGDGLAQWEPTDILAGNMNNALSPKPQVAAGGVGVGRRCGGVGVGGGGGGVRSVRNGGSVNIIFDDISKKPFSTTPSSSLMRKGGGGSILPPRAAALYPAGAPNAFAWSARPV
ncbi:unnamed protein product [Ectocarpus sp. 4 AP-2014]